MGRDKCFVTAFIPVATIVTFSQNPKYKTKILYLLWLRFPNKLPAPVNAFYEQ